MTGSQTIKIAFVGCGLIAQDHWRGIQTHASQFQVTAAIDIDPVRAAEMAEMTGGQPFISLEDALEKSEFEAVDIMLPHDIHESAATLAFGSGKHVLLEKNLPEIFPSLVGVARPANVALDVVRLQGVAAITIAGKTLPAELLALRVGRYQFGNPSKGACK